MSSTRETVEDMALDIERRGVLFFKDLLDLAERAYDAGIAAERAAKPEVWVVTMDYETSAGGDDSEDVGLFWSQAGAEKFREEYLVAHEYERPDRVSVYRAQVKP